MLWHAEPSFLTNLCPVVGWPHAVHQSPWTRNSDVTLSLNPLVCSARSRRRACKLRLAASGKRPFTRLHAHNPKAGGLVLLEPEWRQTLRETPQQGLL